MGASKVSLALTVTHKSFPALPCRSIWVVQFGELVQSHGDCCSSRHCRQTHNVWQGNAHPFSHFSEVQYTIKCTNVYLDEFYIFIHLHDYHLDQDTERF